MPKVYIIIVNYKGWKDTIECLESLLKLNYQNFQVLIIDNSPDRSSFDQICQWASAGLMVETAYKDLVYPVSTKPLKSFVQASENELYKNTYFEQIILVRSNANDGFSSANNLGLRYALSCNDFKFAWLLNNDTVVDPLSLSNLVEFMIQPGMEKIGILGAKVMEYKNHRIIQSAGGGKLIKPLAYSRLIGAGQKDEQQFNRPDVKMDFVAGTSMFVRIEFLTEVGMMGEEYFLYYEEPDWAERGKKLKWQMHYCPKATVYHKGGATTGGKGYSSGSKASTPMSDYYFQRAKILFTRKYYWYWMPSVYLSFIFIIFNRIRRGQFDRIKNLIKILFYPSQRFQHK